MLLSSIETCISIDWCRLCLQFYMTFPSTLLSLQNFKQLNKTCHVVSGHFVVLITTGIDQIRSFFNNNKNKTFLMIITNFTQTVNTDMTILSTQMRKYNKRARHNKMCVFTTSPEVKM